MNKLLLTLTAVLFLTTLCIGQLELDPKISWSENYKKSTKYLIGSTDKNDVYKEDNTLIIVDKGATDHNMHDKIEIPTSHNGQDFATIATFVLKNEILTISKYDLKKEEKSYYHLNKLDDAGKIKEQIELAETDWIKPVYGLSKKKLAAYQEKMKTSNANSFNVVFSENREFVVTYKKKQPAGDSQIFVTRYFDGDLHVVDSEMEWPKVDVTPAKYILSNTGKLFIVSYLIERQGSKNMFVYSAQAMKEEIYSDPIGRNANIILGGILQPSELYLTYKDMKVDNASKTIPFENEGNIRQYETKFHKDLFVVYGTRIVDKVIVGGFKLGIDINDLSVKFKDDFNFNVEHIADYTNAAKEDNEYNDIRFRDFIIHDNNSMTLLAEKFQSSGYGNAYKKKTSINVMSIPQPGTAAVTSPIEFRYMDILAIHMNKDGKITSEQIIKKDQSVTGSDRSAASQIITFASFHGFSMDNMTYLLYNELKANILEMEPTKKLFRADPGEECIVAIAKVDPNSDVEKEVFIDFGDKERGVFQPTLSKQMENYTFTIYTLEHKHQIADKWREAEVSF